MWCYRLEHKCKITLQKYNHVDKAGINNYWMLPGYSKKAAKKLWMGTKTPNQQQG